MLFSAGTFLYVATVHVLPEIVNESPSYLPVSNVDTSSNAAGSSTADSTTVPHSHGNGAFRLNELVALIVGAVTPLFLTMGHSH